MIGDLGNVLNIGPTSILEMRRSDNAIPFMLGLSGVMVGESTSPFGSRTFMEGWRLASSTANDIQRYNPRYLAAVQSRL